MWSVIWTASANASTTASDAAQTLEPVEEEDDERQDADEQHARRVPCPESANAAIVRSRRRKWKARRRRRGQVQWTKNERRISN